MHGGTEPLEATPTGRASDDLPGDLPGATRSTSVPGGHRATRLLAHRPALPSGRAVVGGLLVVVAVIAVFVLATDPGAGPHGRAVVASREVPVGHVLTPDDLRLEPVELPPAVAATTFASVDEAVGSVTLGPLGPDDVVARSDVLEPAVTDGQGTAEAAGTTPVPEVSFPMDRQRAVNGHLRPGESVDLLATYGSGESASTVVAARGVRLVAVEEAAKGTLGSTGTVVVTLALPGRDAVLRATHASQVAEVSLVRATGVVADPAGTPPADRYPDPASSTSPTPGQRSGS